MTLQAPAVVEALDFEAILADIKARIVALMPAAAAVIELESEPLNILAQAFAYRELLYRARVNDAAAAQYIETASGADLDHKADFYGLQRQSGESDERLRLRLRAAILALAGNGTREAYEARALAAHPGVRQARAAQIAPGSVGVVVWPAAGQDGAQVLAAVRAALMADNARVLGVSLSVTLAQPVTFDVRATITREASAPADLLQRLRQHLQEAVESYPIGRAMPRAWVSAQLYQSGVAAVQFSAPDAPPETLPISPGQYPTIGALVLEDGGSV